MLSLPRVPSSNQSSLIFGPRLQASERVRETGGRNRLRARPVCFFFARSHCERRVPECVTACGGVAKESRQLPSGRHLFSIALCCLLLGGCRHWGDWPCFRYFCSSFLRTEFLLQDFLGASPLQAIALPTAHLSDRRTVGVRATLGRVIWTLLSSHLSAAGWQKASFWRFQMACAGCASRRVRVLVGFLVFALRNRLPKLTFVDRLSFGGDEVCA